MFADAYTTHPLAVHTSMPVISVARVFMPCLSWIITESSFFISASPAPFSKN